MVGVNQDTLTGPLSRAPGAAKMQGASGSDVQHCPLTPFPAGERLNAAAYWAALSQHAVPWSLGRLLGPSRRRTRPPAGRGDPLNGPLHITLPAGKCGRQRFGHHRLGHRFDRHFFGSVLESKAQGSSMPNLAALESSIRRLWAALCCSSIRRACASFHRRREEGSPLAAPEWSWLALNISLYPISAFQGQKFCNKHISNLFEVKKRRLFAELRATLYITSN